MATDIDLRGDGESDRRERLFDAIDGADPGDTLAVTADGDLDVHLVRYQIERDRRLAWEHADPDTEPRELDVTVGEPLADDALATIDVRDLTPQRRHAVLLDLFEELPAGEEFVLVNDHDPKPLYHELRSMHGDVIDWEYASRDAGEWRVEIGKDADSEGVGSEEANGEAATDGVITRYDVREIPKQERHPTIHHRYGMIPEGGTMEIVAPHEPRPLHREFERQYGDSFSWEVVESEPGRCRVQITKSPGVGGHDGADRTGDDRHGDDRDEHHGDDDGDDRDGDATETATSPTDEEALDVIKELDVRDLPPAQRHEQIFDAYDELETGTGFVLVNDHDPKPLYHQFEAEAGPAFRWEYRKRDAGEFRVLIAKAATDEPDDASSSEPEAPF